MKTFNKGNLKSAWSTVRHNRGRSTLTVLGIMIGVASVILIVAIGSGLKQQLKVESGYLGRDIVTIKPESGDNPLQPYITTLSPADAEAVGHVTGVSKVIAFGTLSGMLQSEETGTQSATIIAASAPVKDLLSASLAYGSFYGGTDTTGYTAVIGNRLAAKLFKEEVPLGQSVNLHGQRFIIQGILQSFADTPLSPTSDLNDAIIIPLDVAQKLPNNNLQVYQILAQINSDHKTTVLPAINQAMKNSHGGQTDFRVLAPGDSNVSNDHLINLLTLAIGSIAAISLLVAGIGIMNVMLVSVTERSQEIGIRKAVGATNQQILSQFLTEATLLSVLGGLAGIAVALAIEGVIWLLSDLKPVVSWQVILSAFMVSVAIGVLFGSAPAAKAARRNPIEALRRV